LVYSNGVGVDDDEIRTGNAMILDPYGRILAETCKAGDDMVVADLDASLLEASTGRRWIKTHRPEFAFGARRFDGEDWSAYRFDSGDYSIHSIVVAPDGAVWFPTWGGGIFRYFPPE
jgi:hypothetical protein